jgi:hypothetical protein
LLILFESPKGPFSIIMADKEILREIWDGKVPVCFVLSSDEIIVGGDQPIDQFVSMVWAVDNGRVSASVEI